VTAEQAPDALGVPCPRCRAPKGARCRTADAHYCSPHAVRRRYAARGWEQLSLFEGEQRKTRGQAHALDAQPDWTPAAIAWVRELPEGETFTTEDITAALGLPRVVPGAFRNGAVGGLIPALKARGLIVPVGYAKSKRKRSHAHLIRLWERTAHERTATA